MGEANNVVVDNYNDWKKEPFKIYLDNFFQYINITPIVSKFLGEDIVKSAVLQYFGFNCSDLIITARKLKEDFYNNKLYFNFYDADELQIELINGRKFFLGHDNGIELYF